MRGYVSQPRSLSHRRKFETRVELLVMVCLYILGNGGTFRKCCTLTHISSFEVRNFFIFLDAMYETRDEHVLLQENLAELTRINRYYEFVGMPGCVGSTDVVHIK